MSLWVEGDSYYAFGDSPIRRVPVPAFPVKNLPSNPYYLVILTILFRGQETGKKTRILMPKETLFNETKTWQIPAYDNGEGPERPELSPAAFSRLLSTLAGGTLSMRIPIRRIRRKPCISSLRMVNWRSTCIWPV